MRVFVAESEQAAGRWVADAVRDRAVRGPQVVLGLPTGRTPVPLYAAMRDDAARGRLPLAALRTFNLDEYVGLGRGDAGSFRTEMDTTLFGPLRLSDAQIDFLDGRAADLAAECARYEAAIAEAGGMDLIVLGIGRNGHIAFNEPGASLQARTHVETLTESSRAASVAAFGGRLDAVPTTAVTIGMGTILGARSVVLVAAGASKADVIRGMVTGAVTTWLPASFLQLHTDVTVVADRAAAEGLPPEAWQPLA